MWGKIWLEIARIANLSMPLEYQLEDEGRVLNKGEAYQQISRSVPLMKAVLVYLGGLETIVQNVHDKNPIIEQRETSRAPTR
jgi:hypothetical protein